MQIEQSIKKKETFHDIFQQMLNHRSSSRPPKIELRGILIPIPIRQKHQCHFKIETADNEYLLRMGATTELIAKKLAWEDVKVKGYLDLEEGIFEVEKISLTNRDEPFQISMGPSDLLFELSFGIDRYKKLIAQKGLLDITPDYLAS